MGAWPIQGGAGSAAWTRGGLQLEGQDAEPLLVAFLVALTRGKGPLYAQILKLLNSDRSRSYFHATLEVTPHGGDFALGVL